MLSLLSSPVLTLFGVEPSEVLFFAAYALGVLALIPFWVMAGREDYKTHEIRSWVCLVIMSVTVVHAFLFGCIGLGIVDLLLAYFTFREKEIELVGQADFMMLAHWITVPFVMGTGSGIMLVSSIVFLCTLIGYVLVYRDENGKRWKRGKMVPVVPPYTIAVLILVTYKYPVSVYFWELGW